MKRNGHKIMSIVDREKINEGIWDPFHYRETNGSKKLSEFVDIVRINGQKEDLIKLDFEPIEYKHILKGNSLVILLNEKEDNNGKKYNIVSEQILLFGTMRAYLGNVFITPKAEWLSMKKTFFPLNSEFVQIVPKDGLIYYWWTVLKSPNFLSSLPTGSGGTRPRVNIKTLSQTPISVHQLKEREKINKELMSLAEKEWIDYIKKERILKESWKLDTDGRNNPKGN